MTNRQPPAHYNPPPMFGLRQPEDWPGEWIPGPPRSGRFTVIASDSFAPDTLMDDSAWARPGGFDFRDFAIQSSGPIHGVRYEPHHAPPLTSGTDAEP